MKWINNKWIEMSMMATLTTSIILMWVMLLIINILPTHSILIYEKFLIIRVIEIVWWTIMTILFLYWLVANTDKIRKRWSR